VGRMINRTKKHWFLQQRNSLRPSGKELLSTVVPEDYSIPEGTQHAGPCNQYTLQEGKLVTIVVCIDFFQVYQYCYCFRGGIAQGVPYTATITDLLFSHMSSNHF
jgi:hypothetical protein